MVLLLVSLGTDYARNIEMNEYIMIENMFMESVYKNNTRILCTKLIYFSCLID